MVLRSLAVSITCHRKCKIRLLFENESKYKQIFTFLRTYANLGNWVSEEKTERKVVQVSFRSSNADLPS